MNPDNSSIAGIIIATGESDKPGTSTATLKMKDDSFLKIIMRAIRDCGCTPLWVIYGIDPGNIARESEHLGLNAILDESRKIGDLSAIRKIIPQLKGKTAGIMVTLCDYPLVNSDVYHLLCHVFLENPDRILVPIFEGKRGFPIIIPRLLGDDMLKLKGNFYIDDILHNNAGLILEQLVDDPGILRKITAEKDLLI